MKKYCLLARIENSNPITIYPGRLDDDVYYNNNVAWKNCFVVNHSPCGGLFYIGNPEQYIQTMNLKFIDPDKISKNNILDMVSIYLNFDTITWQSINSFFQNNRDIKIISPGRIQILNSDLKFNNIQWSANTQYPVEIQFFLKPNVRHEKKEYKYEIREYLVDSSGLEIGFGGVYFTVDVPEFSNFEAQTSSYVKTNFGNPVNLYAVQQTVTDLIYNWYDSSGELIGTGTNVSVSPDSTSLYRLEVFHSNLCLKDVAEVFVEVNYNFITDVIPNPVINELTVGYQFDAAITNGQIQIINQSGLIIDTFNLNLNLNFITMNVSKYQSGTYTIRLIGNGVNYDRKNFVKL